MSIESATLLQIQEAAAQGDWSQERIDAAMSHAGHEAMAHVEAAQTEHDKQLRQGLGLRAARLQVDLDEFAMGNVDQDRLQEVQNQLQR